VNVETCSIDLLAGIGEANDKNGRALAQARKGPIEGAGALAETSTQTVESHHRGDDKLGRHRLRENRRCEDRESVWCKRLVVTYKPEYQGLVTIHGDRQGKGGAAGNEPRDERARIEFGALGVVSAEDFEWRQAVKGECACRQVSRVGEIPREPATPTAHLVSKDDLTVGLGQAQLG
jgi:hypothetical protein